ncbi:hypothetical protein RSAG8_07655, partial [Rhizoctonia solani AG-8 WAC10335]
MTEILMLPKGRDKEPKEPKGPESPQPRIQKHLKPKQPPPPQEEDEEDKELQPLTPLLIPQFALKSMPIREKGATSHWKQADGPEAGSSEAPNPKMTWVANQTDMEQLVKLGKAKPVGTIKIRAPVQPLDHNLHDCKQ